MKETISVYCENNPASEKVSYEVSLIRELTNSNPDLVFMLADKNLGIAFATTLDYNRYVMKHLNSDKYQLINTDDQTDFRWVGSMAFFESCQDALYSLCTSYLFSKEEKKFLKSLENNYRLPNFHVLPKVHKAFDSTGDPETRPLVSLLQWITTPASLLLESYLKDYLQSQPHQFPNILRDSSELIEHLNLLNALPDGFILVTLDVSALYTNINLDLLNSLLHQIDPKFALLSHFITDNNYFQFANSVYKQLDGIAMGTNCAVSLANLFLAINLDPFIYDRRDAVLLFFRFIDDLILIWTKSKPELLDFIETLQSLIPGIKFTFKASPELVAYLDLNIFIKDGSIHYSTYQKSMNRYQYITRRSCHAPHIFPAYIVGELKRYKRTNSQQYTFEHMKGLFRVRLLKVGFAPYELSTLFNKIRWNSIEESKQELNLKPIALVLPYTLRNNFRQLTLCLKAYEEKLLEPLPKDKYQFIIGYSKCPSIGQLLCKSGLTAHQKAVIERDRSERIGEFL